MYVLDMLAPPNQKAGGAKLRVHVYTRPPFDELGHVCVVQLRVDVRFDPVKEGGRRRVLADALGYLVQHLLRECLQ